MNAGQIIQLLRKDFLLEWRQKYALYGILLYIAATIFVLYLAAGDPDPETWNALFWITQLFICINAVAKSFLQESRGRMLYFYSIADPVSFLVAKVIYNLLLMAVMNLITLFLFTAFMGSAPVNFGMFCAISLLGALGLSLVFTMLAAIAARALQQASLMAILGFPVIIPQVLLLMRLSKLAFAETFNAGVPLQVVGLLLTLDLAVFILSLILFPFLWKD